eukprot:10696692-Alexandrium_andersonii.AAC.1
MASRATFQVWFGYVLGGRYRWQFAAGQHGPCVAKASSAVLARPRCFWNLHHCALAGCVGCIRASASV